jgi:hypothetical protein
MAKSEESLTALERDVETAKAEVDKPFRRTASRSVFKFSFVSLILGRYAHRSGQCLLQILAGRHGG